MQSLDLAGLDALRASVAGPVVAAGDPALTTEAATHNLAITHDPAVVVGATTAQDVQVAVRWAAERGLPVGVQTTGHAPITPVQGGLLITTTRMGSVAIDPDRRLATVGAGTRWADVIAAAAPHGLAALAGSTSHVGVVGYTLGGGVGLLSREFGFAADLVTRASLVTADGDLRRVDAYSEPDLFWALRGARGNFGVVTELEFELVPVPELYAGGIFYAGEAAADVLHAYREWTAGLSERTTSSVALLRLPNLPAVPEPIRGRLVVHLRVGHHGPADEGAQMLAPMRAAGPIVMEQVGVLPTTALDSVHNDPTTPAPVWDRGAVLADLPAEAVDAVIAAAGPGVDTALVIVEVRHLGGAMARQPAVPNAVSGREGQFSIGVIGMLAPDVAARVPQEGTALLERMHPWLTGTSVLNFLGAATTPEQVATAWPPDVHQRLLAIKHRVDPDNLFRYGHALV